MPHFYAHYLTHEQAQDLLEAELLAHGTGTVTVWFNKRTLQYFLTGGPMFTRYQYVQAQGFEGFTYTLPHTVKPRLGLRDGMVDTVARVLAVYHRWQKPINPFEVWPALDEHIAPEL